MVDGDTFRKLAGSFPAGVTVITSLTGDGYYAMTATAFSSLSLEPPLVLVCVDKKAASAAYISQNRVFGVNILSADQQQLSQACASRRNAESRLDGVRFHVGALGLPIIEGCLANLECELAFEYDGGDHIIYAGLVRSGETHPGLEPLLYFRGAYGGFVAQEAAAAVSAAAPA